MIQHDMTVSTKSHSHRSWTIVIIDHGHRGKLQPPSYRYRTSICNLRLHCLLATLSASEEIRS
eukprot:47774-Eustigmatos_ZCMA.PRE.1